MDVSAEFGTSGDVEGATSPARISESCCLADIAARAVGAGTCHIDPAGALTLDPVAQATFGLPAPTTFREVLGKVARGDRRKLLSAIRAADVWPGRLSIEAWLVGQGDADRCLKAVAERIEGHCAGACIVVSLLDVTAERVELDALRQSEEHL